jgi:beta-glucanase (GH16 family)
MAGAFRFMLGFYPKTEAIEAKRQNLIAEFNKIKEIEASEELSRYFSLKKLAASSEFLEKKKNLQSLGYKGSEEHLKEEEYLGMKKMSDIKFFYKYKSSSDLATYTQTLNSSELAEYKSLKAFIESDAYKTVYEYLNDKKRFERTPEFKQLKEYNSIKENPAFKNYFKFVSDKHFKESYDLHRSQELEKFKGLEKYIHSPEFAQAKAGKDFKKSDAYAKFIEYKTFRNSAKYKAYLKLINSPLYGDYKKISNSEELNYFMQLQKTVESDAFKTKRKEIETQKFESTPEYQKFKRFKELENSSLLKKFFKVHHSKQLAQYKQLENSKEIAHYEELQKYIQSEEFSKKKAYLLDPKKWEQTEEYKQETELHQLMKSPALLNYFKIKDDPCFNDLKTWDLVFEDNFDKGKLDGDKWITRYFWGEMLMGDSYALPGEKHYFTDKNVEMNGSTVKLVTRQNKVSGREWNPALGFYPKDFDYSSGMISTGKSHRQKYGRIEAKVRIPATQGIIHAFWLSGNGILPQVDIFKYSNQKLHFSSFWKSSEDASGTNSDVASLSASAFTKGFFIYSLEWTPDKMIWKINNLVVKEQTVGVPEEPLYLVINSGKYDEANVSLPANLEVDWVRCYERRVN